MSPVERTQITDGIPVLLELAERNTAEYLKTAVQIIDAQFGEGYAKQNPALVGAFIQACAQDFHTRLMKVAAQDLGDAVGTLGDVAMAVEAFTSAFTEKS